MIFHDEVFRIKIAAANLKFLDDKDERKSSCARKVFLCRIQETPGRRFAHIKKRVKRKFSNKIILMVKKNAKVVKR